MIRKTGADVPKIARPAKTRGPDGARALDRAEQGRMVDAGQQQIARATTKHEGLAARAQEAAAAFQRFLAASGGDDGQLRRSDLAERAALHAAAVGTEASMLANVASAKLGMARAEAAADGTITSSERDGLKALQHQQATLTAQADDALSRAAAMKQAAAKERGSELVADMTQLAGRTSVVDKRLVWRDARDRLAAFEAKVGRDPSSEADRRALSSLRADKSAAWRNLLAEHGKQKLLTRAADLLQQGAGAITVEQRGELEGRIAKITKMQQGADKMSDLAKTERLAARGARASSSSAAGTSSASASRAAAGAPSSSTSSASSASSTGATSSTSSSGASSSAATGAPSAGATTSSSGASSARAANGPAGATQSGPVDWSGALKVVGDALKQAFTRFADAAGEKRRAPDEAKWAAAREQGFVYGKDAEDAAKGRTGTSLLGLKEIVVEQMKEEPLGRLLAKALRL